MSAKMIEHRGIVQRVDGGLAIVAMETAGCAACGQGGSCGVGKMAAGRPATLLTLPVTADVRAGDVVLIGLPESRLTLSALLGYLFPAFAMLLGAALGAAFQGGDGATALGAMLGFIGALMLARVVIALLPGLMPVPQLIPLSGQPPSFSKEQDHD